MGTPRWGMYLGETMTMVSIIHVSCTRPGLTTVSLSEGHEERMDRQIILVFTWKTEWRIG